MYNDQPDNFISVIIEILSTGLTDVREIETADKPDTELTIAAMDFHNFLIKKLNDKRSDGYLAIFSVKHYNYILSKYGEASVKKLLSMIRSKLSAHVESNEASYCACNTFVAYLDCDEKSAKQRLTMLFSDITASASDLGFGSHIHFICGAYHLSDEDTAISDIIHRANDSIKIAALVPGNINKTVFYDKEIAAHLKRTENISNDMYSILQNNELTIEIQPKYDLKTGKCISAEALARWKHPVFGNISPNEFIPIAETIGMINDIDMFVLETVCKYMRSWMDMGIQPVPVSVNQSRMHISDPNYVNSVFALMQKYDVWPNLIALETTEPFAFNDYTALTRVLSQLHNYGFILSMDDFGSGYSSLHMLSKLEYDVLKLDIKLVQSCCSTSSRGSTIIRHIVSMAHDLNMKIVAEGIETKEQAKLMKELDCDAAQGFYFARPMSIDNFEASVFGYVRPNA